MRRSAPRARPRSTRTSRPGWRQRARRLTWRPPTVPRRRVPRSDSRRASRSLSGCARRLAPEGGARPHLIFRAHRPLVPFRSCLRALRTWAIWHVLSSLNGLSPLECHDTEELGGWVACDWVRVGRLRGSWRFDRGSTSPASSFDRSGEAHSPGCLGPPPCPRAPHGQPGRVAARRPRRARRRHGRDQPGARRWAVPRQRRFQLPGLQREWLPVPEPAEPHPVGLRATGVSGGSTRPTRRPVSPRTGPASR